MSDFLNRAAAIRQQQNAAALAQQDASIAKGAAFWDNLPSAFQSFYDHQYAAQDAAIQRGQEFGALGVLGLVPGNTPSESPTLVSSRSGGASGSGSSAKSVASSPVSPAAFEYLNADLAKYYGMSKSTAYQEALENTAYQRAMKDMKAAGLNPAVMFGSGRANGAGSNVYPSSGGSGGSYSRRSGGSSRSRSGDLFSPGIYGAISAIGGLIGIATTKKPDGFWIGSSVSQGAMQLMNAAYKNG